MINLENNHKGTEMTSEKIKEYLLQIVDNVTEKRNLEDIYNQQALLEDIDISEEQEKNGETFTQSEVEKQSRE